MGRDLPVIGNRAEMTLHSESAPLANLLVDNFTGRNPFAGRFRFVLVAVQSNRLETDSSVAVRPIASPISVAIGSTRILPEASTSLVG
jgi:hypothetical protein